MKAIHKVAWIEIQEGRILSTRSRGKDTFYLPGGKPEAGETYLEALLREIQEELSVLLLAATVEEAGSFQAQAHGQPAGTMVLMDCYTAHFEGQLKPSAEIEEVAWLSYADRDKVSPVDQLIFDYFKEEGLLQ